MKKSTVLLALILCFSLPGQAQNSSADSYRDIPIIISVQFHSMSLPFQNIKSNFSNIGIGIGTEISLNGRDNWAQQFTFVWYRNRAIGNGSFFYTQTAWRPHITSGLHTGLKAGVGYLVSGRPTESYRQVNGEWISVGRKGKGMLAIPVGTSIGYHNYSPGTSLSPFASYQFLLVTGYNPTIPVVPQTLVQAGTRIHIERND